MDFPSSMPNGLRLISHQYPVLSESKSREYIHSVKTLLGRCKLFFTPTAWVKYYLKCCGNLFFYSDSINIYWNLVLHWLALWSLSSGYADLTKKIGGQYIQAKKKKNTTTKQNISVIVLFLRPGFKKSLQILCWFYNFLCVIQLSLLEVGLQ